jgi:hypothetical protein
MPNVSIAPINYWFLKCLYILNTAYPIAIRRTKFTTVIIYTVRLNVIASTSLWVTECVTPGFSDAIFVVDLQ